MKKYPTIACCGIDCGLCPTHYTKGSSRCPGCGGPGFSDKHPSCGILTCSVKNKGYETCSDCEEFPCSRLKGWDKIDSFVTHQVSLSNLRSIKEIGIEKFIEQQKKRIGILEEFLGQYNEGRSKSFYCISTAHMSISDLEAVLEKSKEDIKNGNIKSSDIKTKSKILKDHLSELAKKEKIALKLKKK